MSFVTKCVDEACSLVLNRVEELGLDVQDGCQDDEWFYWEWVDEACNLYETHVVFGKNDDGSNTFGIRCGYTEPKGEQFDWTFPASIDGLSVGSVARMVTDCLANTVQQHIERGVDGV